MYMYMYAATTASRIAGSSRTDGDSLYCLSSGENRPCSALRLRGPAARLTGQPHGCITHRHAPPAGGTTTVGTSHPSPSGPPVPLAPHPTLTAGPAWVTCRDCHLSRRPTPAHLTLWAAMLVGSASYVATAT